MIDQATFSMLVDWLVSATIKGSVVIALVAAIQILIGPRIGPRWRYALWLLVVIRLAVPVAPSSNWSIFNLFAETGATLQTVPHEIPLAAVHAAGSPARGAAQFIVVPPAVTTRAGIIVVSIWLGVAILFLLRATIASVRLKHAVRRALRSGAAVDSRVSALVAETMQQLNISRPVALIETTLVEAPALHGIVRPVLLMPPGLIASFDDNELRHIFLHELWHLRRADVAVNWILSATQALHWFNPFVWFALARIREERELACDELALSCLEQGERVGYGRTILKLLERFRTAAPVPALVGIVNQKQQMKRRMQMIATFRNRTRFSVLFIAATAFIGAVAMTDATSDHGAVEKKLMRKIAFDPATHATMEKMHQHVSLDLSNASFTELLSTVSASAGVPITQAPDIATSRAQGARFSVNAKNVPAHIILMEALMPFELMPQPGADGVVIGEGGPMHHRVHMARAEHAAEAGAMKRKIIVAAPGTAVTEDVDELHIREGSAKRMIRIKADGTGETELSAEGKLHRELKTVFEINGVSSEGSLTIDIQAAPASQ